MLKKLGILFFSVLFLSQISGTVIAQEEVESDFVSGIVLEVSSSSITVIDSDYDDEVRVTVVINADTTFENIQSISEIQEGDEVFIEFVTGQENIALTIFKVGMDLGIEDDENVDDYTVSEGMQYGTEEEK